MLSCSLTEILKITIYFKVCIGTAVVIDFGFKFVHKQLQEAQALSVVIKPGSFNIFLW